MDNAMGQNKVYLYGKSNTFFKVLAYLSILTASFDTFLVVELGGFTLRFSQFTMIFLILLLFCNVIRIGKITIPFNYSLVAGYVFLNTLFIFNAEDKKTSILYGMWLVLDALTILAIANVFKTKKDIIALFKICVAAIILTACIGIVQYILLKFGITFFIQNNSYTIGNFTRIRGFSYEPSYFGTYLIFGWCCLAYLVEKKNTLIFSLKIEKFFLLILSIAFLLSFSRMNLLIIFAYLIIRLLDNITPSVFKGNNALILKKKNIRFAAAMLFLIAIIIFYFFFLYKFRFTQLQKMVAGLGILGNASHSSEGRIEGIIKTIKIFFSSPIIGCSIGDLDYKIFKISTQYHTINGRVSGLSTNMFAEAFAATGIFGGFLFLLYNIRLIFGCIKKRLNHNVVNNDYITFLKSLCIGYTFQIITMFMHGGSLRIYLWINMAIISVAYGGLEFFKIQHKQTNCKSEFLKMP